MFLTAHLAITRKSVSLLHLYASRLLHTTVMSVKLRIYRGLSHCALIISFPCIHTWTTTVQALQTVHLVL